VDYFPVLPLHGSFKILSDLGDLPHLQSVRFPGYHYRPPLLEGDTHMEGQAQGQHPKDETLFMRAPLLVQLYGPFVTNLSFPACSCALYVQDKVRIDGGAN